MLKMSGELSVRHVTKLDGKNFLEWKFQIRAVLISHELLNIVDGTRVKPAADEAECLKAWTKDNAKAMYVISSALEPEQLNCLLSCTSAKEIWDKFVTIHERKTETHKLLMQRFHDCKMDSSESVVKFVSKVQNMAL